MDCWKWSTVFRINLEWKQWPEENVEKLVWNNEEISWSSSGRSGREHTNCEGLWCKRSKFLQSCPTLCDPMDCSLQESSTHGIFQARVLEWGAIAFSCFHSRFLLNTVLHFQQSTTEAEISLPYLTAKVEQKKLPRVLIKIMKTHAILILFLLHHYHWLIFTSLKYVWKYRKNRPGRGN